MSCVFVFQNALVTFTAIHNSIFTALASADGSEM
jgi:hypothetical protein